MKGRRSGWEISGHGIPRRGSQSKTPADVEAGWLALLARCRPEQSMAEQGKESRTVDGRTKVAVELAARSTHFDRYDTIMVGTASILLLPGRLPVWYVRRACHYLHRERVSVMQHSSWCLVARQPEKLNSST